MSGRRRGAVGEAGAGSILAVGILGATLALSSLLVPVAAVLIADRRVAAAADAAALAAADVAVGIAPGSPCGVAASVAAANGAALERCAVDGLVVTVRAMLPVLGFRVGGTATAGPHRPSARGFPVPTGPPL